MPSLWFAEGHNAVAPVYLYRFDYASPVMKLLLVGAAHATGNCPMSGDPRVPRDMTLRSAAPKPPRRCPAHPQPVGQLRGHRQAGRPARRNQVDALPGGRPGLSRVIDHHDRIVHDLDADIRTAWGADPVHLR